jgi:signal transduction histidine kinase
MSNLPAPVIELLQRQAVERRSPAFVHVDSDARVIDAGGDLQKYGFEDLAHGDAVDRQMPFLQGLLESGDTDPHLLTVVTDSGVVADVFLVRSKKTDWLVLLDATLERAQQQLIQQTTNELRLLQTRSGKDGDDGEGSPTVQLLAALGIAAFERLEGGHIRAIGVPPKWFAEIWPEVAANVNDATLAKSSPFVEGFINEADSVWRSGDRILRSGPWTEVDPSGNEWHLEASALISGGQAMLVIVDTGRRYQEMTGLLQRARENVLDHQALLSEIEKKDVLLHSIVHDLRSPMVSAHSGFQLLEAENLSPAGRRTLDIGMKELERQERLIRSILDVFAADIKGLRRADATLSTTDVLDCARAVVESFTSVYELQRVDLELDVADELAASWQVAGDRMRLIRVYGNLVDNALRHSSAGAKVRIVISREAETVLVQVEDEGPGVPAAIADRLFDRFTQVGSSRGTMGLGLHFCRITIEGWGGEIGFDNRPEGGARFWFRLNTIEPR